VSSNVIKMKKKKKNPSPETWTGGRKMAELGRGSQGT
jgi:hypothetical protein